MLGIIEQVFPNQRLVYAITHEALYEFAFNKS